MTRCTKIKRNLLKILISYVLIYVGYVFVLRVPMESRTVGTMMSVMIDKGTLHDTANATTGSTMNAGTINEKNITNPESTIIPTQPETPRNRPSDFSKKHRINHPAETPATNRFFGHTHIEKTFKFLKVFGASDKVPRRENVKFTIGIPTVKRDKDFYLIKTLSGLLNMSQAEKQLCLIIVFVAEPHNYTFVEYVYNLIKQMFPDDLKSGLIEVIYPTSDLYPDLEHLKRGYNDSPDRVKWRTKENLDAAHLMTYAKDRGRYFLFFEDDVVAKPGYFNSMNAQVERETQTDNQWMTINIVRRNSKGLLFKSEYLWIFSEFIFMFYDDKPIDFLYMDLFRMKTCQKYTTKQDLEKCINVYKREGKGGNFFVHIGKHSSLTGQTRKDVPK